MTGRERIAKALKGEKPDKIPIMLHNFMPAAREAGISMKEYRENPKEIARAFIESVEKYRYDGVLVDIDTVTLAGACGVPIDFPEDDPARSHLGCLTDYAGLPGLKIPDLSTYKWSANWLEATLLIKDYFGSILSSGCSRTGYVKIKNFMFECTFGQTANGRRQK